MSGSAIVDAVLAHQGGWDEILLIGGPMLVIVALLVVAKKRVDKAARSASDAATDQDSTTGDRT